MVKKLTAEERAEIIRLRIEEMADTNFLSAKFKVSPRSIQRVIKPEPRESGAKKGKPVRSAPPEKRSENGCVQKKSPFLPKKGAYNSERLLNGSVLAFGKDGTLRRVLRCPIYGTQYATWLVRDVEVLGIEDGIIHARIPKWDGETVDGCLVFGANRLPYFYASNLPEKVEADAEAVRTARRERAADLRAHLAHEPR
jgi:hypothetical protein